MMNWHMIVYGLIVVVIKAVGMTLFLLYFPQVFGNSSDGFNPTENYGTDNVQNVSQIFERNSEGFLPTGSYGTACPSDWEFYQGRCFWFSISESPWNNSNDDCMTKGAMLAIADTAEKLMTKKEQPSECCKLSKVEHPCGKQKCLQNYLQTIAGTERYYIGLRRQPAEKTWRWTNKSLFRGNVTNENPNFNCVTIGLTKTFDAALCETRYRWICEKPSK